MTTQAPKHFLMFLTNYKDPAREQECSEWYTNVHMPDALETPGIMRGLRFCLATEPVEGQAKFLTLYELDRDDPASVEKALGEVMARKRTQGRTMDCLQMVGTGYYNLISDTIKQTTPP